MGSERGHRHVELSTWIKLLQIGASSLRNKEACFLSTKNRFPTLGRRREEFRKQNRALLLGCVLSVTFTVSPTMGPLGGAGEARGAAGNLGIVPG